MSIQIVRATTSDAQDIAAMLGDLLQAIMEGVGDPAAFHYEFDASCERARQLIEARRYVAFMASDQARHSHVGFIAMYECHALYAEGTFGTIAELYVRPPYRSQGIGTALVERGKQFGAANGWTRMEVTTPPLPQFDRALNFYGKFGFVVTGGKKMRCTL